MTIKSKLIFVFILVLVISIGGYKYFSKSEELPYDWVLVGKGNIIQKVSATGQVIPAKKIDLQFEIQGKIKDIKAMVGEKVETGDVLAVLDTGELNTQILEAQAVLDIARAKLDKLLAGASLEEIKIAETQVESAQIALRIAEENLNNSYETAITVLDSSYPQIYNALDFVKEFVKEYVAIYDEDGRTIMRARDEIERAEAEAKLYLGIAKESSKKVEEDSFFSTPAEASVEEDVETALLIMENSLEAAFNNLETIREIADESAIYREKISAADKVSLGTLKTNINGALTNVIGVQQTISSMKSNVETAQTKLQEDESRLDLVKAEIHQVDIDLYEAQVNQAEASFTRAKQELAKASLVAPYSGTITNIEKEEGEMAKLGEFIISIISFNKFQIEVDIPEADVGKVSQQNPAEITLDAFPDYKFSGKVIKIDPAETVIQGVVYYKVTVGFDEPDERMKSGMTANVDIITETKENVLTVPQGAVLAKDGQKMVRILEGKDIKEVKVETGIRGSRGEIEILSGLKEGDKVITFIKK
jgi:HlyD family secretion protein